MLTAPVKYAIIRVLPLIQMNLNSTLAGLKSLKQEAEVDHNNLKTILKSHSSLQTDDLRFIEESKFIRW